jgi:hypothetical protein
MAKANIDLPNGTKIVVDGTSEDINAVLKIFSTLPTASAEEKKAKSKRKHSTRKTTGSKKIPKGPSRYIIELKAEGFYYKKKTLKHIQQKLEENGQIYPQTHLSTPLKRLVRPPKNELRRMKENGNWVYVKA